MAIRNPLRFRLRQPVPAGTLCVVVHINDPSDRPGSAMPSRRPWSRAQNATFLDRRQTQNKCRFAIRP
jgi:hypothetical protein